MTRVTRSRAGIFPALVCFAGLLQACGARAPEVQPPRPDSVRTTQVAPGVIHDYRWYANGPFAVHELTVDPRVCSVDFRTIKSGDRVIGREPTSALSLRGTSKFGAQVLAATNADFFSYEPNGISEGPQISQGVLLKSEGVHREALEDSLVRLQPVFAFTQDRKPIITYTRFSGTVRGRQGSTQLGGVNVKPLLNRAVLYDSMFGSATPSDTAALELVVRTTRTRTGVVVALDSAIGGVAIPKDGFVVFLHGSARTAMPRPAVGDTVSWSYRFENLPDNVAELIGGYPMLLVNGKHMHHEEAGLIPRFADNKHPRSVIARDRHGRVHIFAVDGRQPAYSAGLSLQELGDYLLAHGYRDALNFDGGGSTTLVVRDKVVNRPSDQNGERHVSNALLVVERACR